jgi:hypothetical protein
MEDRSIESTNEILLINEEGYYPENVYEEVNFLGVESNTHSFFWHYNGPHETPDFEPVSVDKLEKYALTRFHNRGLILWLDYKKEKNKPIARFYTWWHIPMLCSGYFPHPLKRPTIPEDRIAYAGLFLGRLWFW